MKECRSLALQFETWLTEFDNVFETYTSRAYNKDHGKAIDKTTDKTLFVISKELDEDIENTATIVDAAANTKNTVDAANTGTNAGVIANTKNTDTKNTNTLETLETQ